MAMTGNMRDDLTWMHGANMQPGGAVPSGLGNANQTPVAEWAQGMDPQQQALANMVAQPTQVPNLQSNVDMQPAAIGMLIANALGALSNDPNVLPRVQAQGMQGLNFVNRQAQQDIQRKALQARMKMSADQINMQKLQTSISMTEKKIAGQMGTMLMDAYASGGVEGIRNMLQNPNYKELAAKGGLRGQAMSYQYFKTMLTQENHQELMRLRRAQIAGNASARELRNKILEIKLNNAKLKNAILVNQSDPEIKTWNNKVTEALNKKDWKGASALISNPPAGASMKLVGNLRDLFLKQRNTDEGRTVQAGKAQKNRWWTQYNNTQNRINALEAKFGMLVNDPKAPEYKMMKRLLREREVAAGKLRGLGETVPSDPQKNPSAPATEAGAGQVPSELKPYMNKQPGFKYQTNNGEVWIMTLQGFKRLK